MKRLKTDVDTRFAAVAKPEDVSSAVSPLNNQLAALQQDVQGVIKSEGDRRTTAERIVLSLELANLKRAIDRGKPYAPELAQTRKVAGTVIDLARHPRSIASPSTACRRRPSCGRTSSPSPSRSSTQSSSLKTLPSSTGFWPGRNPSCAFAGHPTAPTTRASRRLSAASRRR
ncbi:MAG: hypothetical protein WDN31_22555 [Hyphomicrobium sp.]